MKNNNNENLMKKQEAKRKTRFRNKRIFQYAMQVKGLVILGLILTILGALAELAGPFLISKILDGQLLEGIGAKDKKIFYILVALYIFSALLVALVRYIMNVSFAKLANKIGYIIRSDVFKHVVSLPVQFFDKYPAGKIVTRITSDTQDIRLLIQILFFDIITTAIFGLGIIISLFWINPFLGLITILSFPIVYLVFIDYKKKSTKYNNDMRRFNSEMNANLNETIQTMEVVQSFNNEDYIYKQYSDLNDKHFGEGKKLATLWSYSSFNATNTLGNLVITIAVIFFALGFLNDKAGIGIGGLYIFVDYNRKLYMYINNLTNRIGELEKAKSAADQVFELLDIHPYLDGKEVIQDLKGDIKFDKVTFSYNDDEEVLKDINLNIAAGESCAFVGHTGSGKSTIMNLIYGFYKINRGRLSFDGKDINDLNMVETRKQMAIVFQNPYIFEGSIYDNIALFDDSISREDAINALINVGGERILIRENGILAHIQEGGGGFSAGEKQLISFARAMVRNPKILLLDEATANVDTETEEYIQYGVNKLKKGRTTLIIAHRLSTIKEVDKIYVLNDGRIVERGNHDQLIEHGGIYAKMYNES